MKCAVSETGCPHQHLLFAVGCFPIERLVSKFSQCSANPVAFIGHLRDIVGTVGKILDVVFHHHICDTPAKPGDIGHHGGINGKMIVFPQGVGILGNPKQLFGRRQTGHHPNIKPCNDHRSVFHGEFQPIKIFCWGVFHKIFHRPQRLHVPDKLAPFGIILGLVDEIQRIQNVLILNFHHLALQMRVADVVVGVVDDVHFAPCHGSLNQRMIINMLFVEFDLDFKRSRFCNGINGNL